MINVGLCLMKIEIISVILVAVTLVVVVLSFISSITNLFKTRAPLACGFLIDNKIGDKLKVSTGDPAKTIVFRFKNLSKFTLSGVVLDIKIFRPLTLSSTNKALDIIQNKTKHYRAKDNTYYFIRLYDLEFFGEKFLDYRVELNTVEKVPGKYKISMTAHQKEYKYRKCELTLDIA